MNVTYQFYIAQMDIELTEDCNADYVMVINESVLVFVHLKMIAVILNRGSTGVFSFTPDFSSLFGANGSPSSGSLLNL